MSKEGLLWNLVWCRQRDLPEAEPFNSLSASIQTMSKNPANTLKEQLYSLKGTIKEKAKELYTVIHHPSFKCPAMRLPTSPTGME